MCSTIDLHETSLSILQDGISQSAKNLKHLATGLAARLAADGLVRIAVTTSRADNIVIALLACKAANCEVILLREAYPMEHSNWREWRVNAILGEDLSLRHLSKNTVVKQRFSILLTTSGTTGTPKVARHELTNLLGRIRTPKSKKEPIIWLLTYHPASFAGMQVLLTSLVGGSALVAVSSPTVSNLADAAVDNHPTHISGTPTFWRAFILALGDEAESLRLKQITLGGEAVDQATLYRLSELFPSAGITHIYASTEAGALFAVSDRRAGFPVAWLEENKEGIGLRIRDNILEVKSPRAMKGYVTKTGTKITTPDGWLITNDIVEVRGDRIIFLGRADSAINVGGAKVFPEEVESVVLEAPGVAEARVVGVANPITGYLVTAEIVLSEGYEEDAVKTSITEHARAALEPFKVPRIINFVRKIEFLDTGKKSRVK